MVPPKNNRNQAGLGRAIINRKIKDARAAREDTDKYTTELDHKLQSVTQERNLDEFLSTAQLAGTEFTAEKQNITIVQNANVNSIGNNPYLLSSQEEKATLQRHAQNKDRLRVPRRPPWTRDLTTSQLERQEREAFLEWRRSIAQLQEAENFLLTPFERNIAVWRQLWRVLERAHLVVQIVDARNPLRFRCADLDSYVHDVEGPEGEKGSGAKGLRRCLLLVNKADLLTADQRRGWADHFDKEGIQYAFFSAANAKALQEAKRLAEEAAHAQGEDGPGSDESDNEEEEEEDDGDSVVDPEGSHGRPSMDDSIEESAPHPDGDASLEVDAHHLPVDAGETDDPRTRVLSVLELEALFLSTAPDLSTFATATNAAPTKLVVGLVGYPNVGKSSTINALLGEKKVSVSSTPGKTKHFQTIHLSPAIVLCDCPGLVFPQFATTKAALVCDGVLPIDQMREYIGPIGLVVRRVPRGVLEGTYGLRIRRRNIEDGGKDDGEEVSAEDLLVSYAIARGFARAGQGLPDEARAARYVLKDYVAGKLLFSHPPPGEDEDTFNARARQLALERLAASGKKMAPATRVGKNADTFLDVDPASAPAATNTGVGGVLDREFFDRNSGLSAGAFVKGGEPFIRSKAFPHQNVVGDDGRVHGAREDMAAIKGKKHNKGNKRAKQRSGKGYD